MFTEFGTHTQDSGNVSYGVQIGSKRYFVKTAGDPDDPEPFLAHSDRVALLRNAFRLARSCHHPALPRLYRSIESPIGPMLVYQWLEGELIGVPRASRDDPQSAFQRFCHLPTDRILKCLNVIYELHRELAQRGWIAVDFYDGCLIYDFSSGRLGVVDLDMYRDGPFHNDMGRMFGSTRFMAPEEFELGSVIDQQSNVFVMGRMVAVFLSDGTLSSEAFRGSSALHQVIAKACQAERTQRFDSIEEFYEAWCRAQAA